MKHFNPLASLEKEHIKELLFIHHFSNIPHKKMLFYLHNNDLINTLESQNLDPSYYCYALEHAFNELTNQ